MAEIDSIIVSVTGIEFHKIVSPIPRSVLIVFAIKCQVGVYYSCL